MKRFVLLVVMLLVCASAAQAQYVKILGVAGQSGKIITSGVTSTTSAFKTYPGATITILNADNTNATIYSDATGTSKSNPYQASLTDATYDFFIRPGATFSVRVSGTSGGVAISTFTRSLQTAPGIPGSAQVICSGSGDATPIQNALNSITRGTVYLSSSPCVLGSTGITFPADNITLEGAAQQISLTYSGSGRAIDGYGRQYGTIKNIYVTTTNDAAKGLRLGHVSRFWRLEDSSFQGTNTLTNTGTGIELAATGGTTPSDQVFSGFLNMDNVYLLGYKFGIAITGTNTGNETWTTIHGGAVTIVGLSSGSGGPIPGSIGIKADINSNLEGSSIDSLIMESYLKQFEYTNCAACYGITVQNSGNEGNGNSNTPVFPASFNGEFSNWHGNGYYYRSTSNGLNNLWDRELRNAGVWTTESLGERIHVIYDGSSSNVRYGLQRGASVVGGGLARDKFIVTTSTAANTSYFRNNFKLLEFTTAYNNAAPTEGSWGIGSQIYNSVPAVGTPSGWVCAASGTFKTALVGVTGGVSLNARSLVVNSISTLAVGDYISIVGVAGTKLIVAVSGTTVTIDSDADATVVAQAVQYVTPTFQPNDNFGTTRAARVTSQFDVTSSMTLANVPMDKMIMLDAGFTYSYVARISTASNVAGGIKFAIGGTSVASSFLCSATVVDADAIYGPTRTTTKGNTVGNKTAVTASYVEIVGTITVSSTGTFTVQFAQNASNGTASSVLVNSTIETKLIG